MTDTQPDLAAYLAAKYPELDDDQLEQLLAKIDVLATKMRQQKSGFGNALKRHRQKAELTQQEVADHLDWSISKVIRIENGAVSVLKTDVWVLLDCYGVTDQSVVGALVEAARADREQRRATAKAEKSANQMEKN